MVLGSYTDRQVVQYAADRAVIQTGERHHNLWRRGAFSSLRIYVFFGTTWTPRSVCLPSCLWSALPATKTSMFILTSCLRLCKVYLYIQELLNHYTPRSTYWLFFSYCPCVTVPGPTMDTYLSVDCAISLLNCLELSNILYCSGYFAKSRFCFTVHSTPSFKLWLFRDKLATAIYIYLFTFYNYFLILSVLLVLPPTFHCHECVAVNNSMRPSYLIENTMTYKKV